MATKQEQNLLNDVEQFYVSRTNENIRKMLDMGMKTEDIGVSLNIPKSSNVNNILASLAISENYNISPSQAMGLSTSIMKQTHGNNYNPEQVVKDYYKSPSSEYELPIKYQSTADFREQIDEEETKLAEQYKKEIEPQEPEVPQNVHLGARGMDFRAYRESGYRDNIQKYRSLQSNFFNDDESQEKFVKNIIHVDEEDKQQVRDERMADLITEQQNRIQSVRDDERKRKILDKEPVGIWYGKYLSAAKGISRIRMSTYQSTGEVFDIINDIFKSAKAKDISDNMNVMARGYWRALEKEPELMVVPHGTVDRMFNSLLENTPQYGLSILESYYFPALSPIFVFTNTAMLEGTMGRQQTLDNGFSETQARQRGWIIGTLNGLLEAQGGGAAKYLPKKKIAQSVIKQASSKIASYAGKLTKNALTEIFREELPQEIVSSILSGDVPRLANGDIDYDEVSRRVISLAEDTAFSSVWFTVGGDALSQSGQWYKDKKADQKFAQMMKDVMVQIATESRTGFAGYGSPEQGFQRKQPQNKEIKKASTKQEQDVSQTKDDLQVESVPEATPIQDMVDSTESYGIFEQSDGKFSIIDWDTQKEVETGLSQKEAVKRTIEYNEGTKQPKITRPRDILPTGSDVETLNHTQLLNVVFKKVSQQARKVASETANAIINTHTDLATYVKQKLDNVDITESQRNTILKHIAESKNDKQKLQTVAVVQAITEMQSKKQALSEHAQLRRLINRNSKKRLVDGGIHYNIYDRLSELLNSYTSLNAKDINSIKRTQSYLNDLKNQIAGDYDAAYAEALIPPKILDKFKELQGMSVEDMTSVELNYLNEQIKHLLKLSQLYSKLIRNRMKDKVQNWMNNAVATLKLKPTSMKTSRLRPKRGKLKSVWDALAGYRNDDIYTLASKLWGKDDPITLMTLQMRQNQIKAFYRLKDMVTGFIQDLKLDDRVLNRWSPFMQRLNVSQAIKEKIGTSADIHKIKINGVERQFFMSELMSLYMHTKNNYNLRAIIKHGIGTYDNGAIGKVTKTELKQMLDIVENNPAAKHFCDMLQMFYMESARLGNEVTKRLDGMNLFNEEDYFHIEYVRQGKVNGKQYVRDSIFDENGRFKGREQAGGEVVLRDIFNVINEDITVMSNFIGQSDYMRTMRSLVNYKPYKNKLVGTPYEHLYHAVNSKLEAIQKDRFQASSVFGKAAQKLGSGAARASLAVPVVWAYQPTSAALYAIECSDKYMVNIARKIGKGFESDLSKNWLLYRSRKEGNTGSRSIGETGDLRRFFTGKRSNADLILSGLHRGDMWGVTRAALIVRAEMNDNNMKGRSLAWWQKYGVNPAALQYGTDEYWKAFNDRADYIVSLTQPMFFAENKNEWSNSDSPYEREAARFRSFVDQIIRIFHRQNTYLAKGDISKYEAARNMGITWLLLALTKPLIKFGWDKYVMGREKELDELFADIVTQPLGLMPFIGYPATKVAKMSLGQGLSTQSIGYSQMSTMMIDNIIKHSADMARGVYYMYNDEYFESGTNYGRSKSDIYLKRGITGTFQDYLVMNGVPAYVYNQIEWLKD